MSAKKQDKKQQNKKKEENDKKQQQNKKKGENDKKQEVVVKSSDEQSALEELFAIDAKLQDIEKQEEEELYKAQVKYTKKKAPLFKERSEIIRKIPDFWQETFLKHEFLKHCFIISDLDVLPSLVDVQLDASEDMKIINVTFTFSENDVFKNKTLSKKYDLTNEDEPTVKGTKIEWKKGKKTTHSKDSFFEWFEMEDGEGYESDPILRTLSDDLWQNPLLTYKLESADEEGAEGEHGDEAEGAKSKEDEAKEEKKPQQKQQQQQQQQQQQSGSKKDKKRKNEEQQQQQKKPKQEGNNNSSSSSNNKQKQQQQQQQQQQKQQQQQQQPQKQQQQKKNKKQQKQKQ